MIIRENPPEDLAPSTDSLYAVAVGGLKLFIKRFGSLRAGMTLRSERSNIHDCIKEEAQKAFETTEKQNLFLMKVGKYRIKPKKLDGRLRSRGIKTQLVFDFLSQNMRLFDDDESVVNLHLGYQPDPIDLTKSLIWLTCPNGTGIDWAFQLSGGASTAGVPEIIMPTAPTITPTRVKPKSDEEIIKRANEQKA